MKDTSTPRLGTTIATGLFMGNLLVIMLLGVALSGCSSVVKEPTEIDELPAISPKATGPYRIVEGDELEVQFFHTPNLNTIVIVRPDGFISLVLTGDVKAAGRTPEELRAAITAVYSRELKDPELAVIVRTFTPHRIHVGGEVRRPGVFELREKLTVMEAIMEAGGGLVTGRMDEVVVVRRVDDSFITVPVDLEKVVAGTDPSQNIELLPYDAVVIPTKSIVDVNNWIDQYIRRNIPISFSANPNSIQ